MYRIVYKRQGMPPAGNFEDSTIVKKLRRSEPESFPESHSPVKPKWQLFLIKYMEPDFGLLDRLLGYDLLFEEEYLAVKTMASVREKNEAIVDCILRKNRYPELLEVLKETNQSHLVNYLTPDGLEILDDNPFSSERLVTYKEELTITANRDILLEVIEGTSDLSRKLHSSGALNRRQKEYISGQPGDIKRNEVLLEILKRGTIGNYEETICCLRSSGQQHAADILDGGASARIRCWIMDANQSTVLKKELEEIVTRFSKRLDEGVNAILELKGLGLRSVKLDNEIIFYFHFTTMEQLQCVRNVFASGEMKASAGRDFESLQLPINQHSISLEWSKNDFTRCVNYFVSSTTIDSLPIEVLDLILLKVFEFRFCPLSSRSFEIDTFKFLRLVSLNWNCTIARRRFKLAEKRLVSRFLKTIFKTRDIIRSNQRFLQENLQPNILINPLVSSGCLTMEQKMRITRLLNRRHRNDELLNVIRSIQFEKQLDFLDCLRSFDQQRIADIIEKGGVAVKLCIKNEATFNVNSIEKDLVDKLQQILRENSDEKLWPHKLFNSVSINDIVILSAQQGTEVIELWLWCQSQDSLERLKVIDAGKLIKITEQLFSRFRSSTSLTPQSTFIDSSNFQFNVVVRRLSVKLRGILLCPLGQRSTGWFRVCSLQDKIYVIPDRTMIHVYEDKAPYRPLESKNLLRPSGVQNPLELAACPVQKCIYIADLAESCVWKMNPADDHQLKKWLPESVSRLSVLSDGKVLVLDNDPTFPKLKIYTPDAIQESTVSLRGDFNTLSFSAAVELLPGVVAVQYDRFDSTNMKGTVIMRLNETGDILCEAETKGISCLTPYSPGRLIAGDQESKQVTVLDSQLKTLRVLLSPVTRNSQWPQFLCYRSDTRELIVHHFGLPYNQFNVYKLSYDNECEW